VTTQTELAAGVAAMPRVNLMPPEIAEAERFRRLQLAMGGAVLASVVIVGALYMHARSGISAAQQEVSSAQAQQTTLQSKLNSLASVKQTFAEVQGKQALLSQAMGQEIRWSYVLNDLSLRVPSDVWLTGVQAGEATVGVGAQNGAAAASTVPGAATSDIGTVDFSGIGFKHDDVAAWLDSIAKERGFTQPTFSSSSETAIGTRQVVDFGSSVILDSSALSNRYVQKAGS
jgi:Tfp pilus assembly protein PilN